MIRFDNVYKTYKTGTNALRGVSFRIEKGEFVFIIGKSGSGKSTIIKLVTREETPTEGRVFVDHFPISHMSRVLIPVLRRHVGMIYQDFRLIESKNVFENVAFAGEIVGMPRKNLIRTVEVVLSVVGLRGKAAAMPCELSGGEQQRVAIARAMVNDPKLILADEPTGNLDPTNSEAIMALLEEINRNGTTVVICTHDSNLVDRMKKRVIEISDGLLIRDERDSGYTCYGDEEDGECVVVDTEDDYRETEDVTDQDDAALWIDDEPQTISPHHEAVKTMFYDPDAPETEPVIDDPTSPVDSIADTPPLSSDIHDETVLDDADADIPFADVFVREDKQ